LESSVPSLRKPRSKSIVPKLSGRAPAMFRENDGGGFLQEQGLSVGVTPNAYRL
jgi:hypothetical protein